jgi:hypothetical protein
MLLSGLNDASPRRRSFNCETSRPKTFPCRERRAELRSLLGCLPHLHRGIRVEVTLVNRHKSDVSWLPHAKDERLSSGRDLMSGLFDRNTCELGAVIGEENRTAGSSDGTSSS